MLDQQPRESVRRTTGKEGKEFLTAAAASSLVRIDGRRAVALKLATEREQMIVHQTADHIEPQQNAVRSMTDRPPESAEGEILQGAVPHLYRKPRRQNTRFNPAARLFEDSRHGPR